MAGKPIEKPKISRRLKLCLVLLLVYVAIIGAFVAIVLVVKSDRQVTRRIFKQVKPCPFGKGTEFTVTEKHVPERKTEATFLFSSCLFGKMSEELEKTYIAPFERSVENIRSLMPEAQVRLYVGESLRDAVFPRLFDKGVQVYVVSPDSKGYEGTLWRFFPIDEDLPFMSMDMDPDVLITPEFVETVRKWLADSTKSFLILRHHLSTMLPLTAGRFLCKPKSIPFNVKEKIETYCDTSFGVDEAFLNRELWKHVKESMAEDSAVCGPEAAAVATLFVLGGLLVSTLYWGCSSCE